jgi:hypothetical protein
LLIRPTTFLSSHQITSYIHFEWFRLDVQRSSFRLGKILLIRLDSSNDLSGSKLLHLLRRTANEGTGVEQSVQLRQDGTEECGAADTLDQVVVFALLLDVVGGLVGEDTWRRSIGAGNKKGMLRLTDFLVGILPGETLLHAGHDDL